MPRFSTPIGSRYFSSGSASLSWREFKPPLDIVQSSFCLQDFFCFLWVFRASLILFLFCISAELVLCSRARELIDLALLLKPEICFTTLVLTIAARRGDSRWITPARLHCFSIIFMSWPKESIIAVQRKMKLIDLSKPVWRLWYLKFNKFILNKRLFSLQLRCQFHVLTKLGNRGCRSKLAFQHGDESKRGVLHLTVG